MRGKDICGASPFHYRQGSRTHTSTLVHKRARNIVVYIRMCMLPYSYIHAYTIVVLWIGFFSFLHFSRSRNNNNIYKKGGASEKYSGTRGPQGEKRPLLGLIVPWWDDLLPGTYIIIHNIYIYRVLFIEHSPPFNTLFYNKLMIFGIFNYS